MRLFFAVGVLVLAVFLVGCDDEQAVSVVLEGNPEIVAAVTKSLQAHPHIAMAPHEGYSIKIIPPEPNIDHKITIVRPDPEIDFKIGIIDPYGSHLPEGLNEKLAGMIREHLREQDEKQK